MAPLRGGEVLVPYGPAAAAERELADLPYVGSEVDEGYFGGRRWGRRRRGAGGNVPVFGLLKRKGEVRVGSPTS
ncbi:MAG: hypothetical protein JWO31_1531 [Phycisphaerales bacterium]|nr:hypothetical protein [Phycisphaerales bacterium]